MRVKLRPAEVSDVKRVLANSDGVWHGHPDPQGLMEKEVREATLSWTWVVDNKVACIIGVRSTNLLSREAYIWLLVAPPLIEKYQFLFIRHSKVLVNNLREQYSFIHGLVVRDASLSKRWLRWLGFTINEDGPNDKLQFFSMGER